MGWGGAVQRNRLFANLRLLLFLRLRGGWFGTRKGAWLLQQYLSVYVFSDSSRLRCIIPRSTFAYDLWVNDR